MAIIMMNNHHGKYYNFRGTPPSSTSRLNDATEATNTTRQGWNNHQQHKSCHNKDKQDYYNQETRFVNKNKNNSYHCHNNNTKQSYFKKGKKAIKHCLQYKRTEKAEQYYDKVTQFYNGKDRPNYYHHCSDVYGDDHHHNNNNSKSNKNCQNQSNDSYKTTTTTTATTSNSTIKKWPPKFETNGAYYTYDPRSCMFYERNSNFFYDLKTKLYFDNSRKLFFRYDEKNLPPFQQIVTPTTTTTTTTPGSPLATSAAPQPATTTAATAAATAAAIATRTVAEANTYNIPQKNTTTPPPMASDDMFVVDDDDFSLEYDCCDSYQPPRPPRWIYIMSKKTTKRKAKRIGSRWDIAALPPIASSSTNITARDATISVPENSIHHPPTWIHIMSKNTTKQKAKRIGSRWDIAATSYSDESALPPIASSSTNTTAREATVSVSGNNIHHNHHHHHHHHQTTQKTTNYESKKMITSSAKSVATDTGMVETTRHGKPICIICQRKFDSLSCLKRHKEISLLHKTNCIRNQKKK